MTNYVLEPGAWTFRGAREQAAPKFRMALAGSPWVGRAFENHELWEPERDQRGEDATWSLPLWPSHHCCPSPPSDPSKDHDSETLFWEPV